MANLKLYDTARAIVCQELNDALTPYSDYPRFQLVLRLRKLQCTTGFWYSVYMADTEQPVPISDTLQQDPSMQAEMPVEEAPVALGETNNLQPEEAQESALPPQEPPIYTAKKPPFILVAVSLVFIFLFIGGLFLILRGKPDSQKASQSQQPSITTTPQPSPSPEQNSPVWVAYTSPYRDFTLDVPSEKTILYDTKAATIDYCKIGSAEASIRIFSDKEMTTLELEMEVARKKNSGMEPADWITENCKELDGPLTQKGIIDEAGVKGLYYVRKYSNATADISPFSLAIIKKGSDLYFVYATAPSDIIMEELYDPMFLSFKLLGN